MSNVLSDDKRQQIIALGRLGWSLRRIEQATGVRRETTSAYLKAAGISVRPPGRWGRAAKPAIEVTTDSDPTKQVNPVLNHPEVSKPAIQVTTDSGLREPGGEESISLPKARTLSHCEPYRELIEAGLQRGRNAMAIYQDLVSEQGFAHSKGKVEAGVGHAKKTPLKGQRFESLAQAQAYLDRWETNWADTRIHGTTKRQVAAMFAEERPHLLPLPLEPFRFYQYGQRAVHLDGCVEVEAAYYSAPPGWIGRRVQVQWDGLNVRLLHPHTGQLLREHLRQKRGWHRIQEADRSPRTPLSTVQLLERASRAGTHIGALCTAIQQRQGQVGVRCIQGVLTLAKRFGPVMVEQACAAALELGVHEYHFVRRYLERQPSLPLTLQQVDPLIRQLEQYRDIIQLRTKESESA